MSVEHRSPSKNSRLPGRPAVDPRQPTVARPGSPEKIEVLRLRNAAGLPLWDSRDRTDHSSEERNSQEFAA